MKKRLNRNLCTKTESEINLTYVSSNFNLFNLFYLRNFHTSVMLMSEKSIYSNKMRHQNYQEQRKLSHLRILNLEIRNKNKILCFL